MNLNEYIQLQEQVDALYTDLENSTTDSEAAGIQRKIDILELKIEDLLYVNNDRYVEQEEY